MTGNKAPTPIRNNGKFLFEQKKRCFHSLEFDEKLLRIEAELRDRCLLYCPKNIALLNNAKYGNDPDQWALKQLQEILEKDRIL